MHSWFSSSDHPPRRSFLRSLAKKSGIILSQEKKERKGGIHRWQRVGKPLNLGKAEKT
jgi:hypothetical protein